MREIDCRRVLRRKAHGPLLVVPALVALASFTGPAGAQSPPSNDSCTSTGSATGGSGRDVICGTSGSDTLLGSNGDDELRGAGGDDILNASAEDGQHSDKTTIQTIGLIETG